MSADSGQEQIQDGEAIQAVAFTPVSMQASRRRWRPGPVATATMGLLAIGIAVLWFLLGARSVAIQLEPESASLQIEGGFDLTIAGRQLLRPGEYRLSATAPGHYPLERTVTVTGAQDQTFKLPLLRLPGLLELDTDPAGAQVHSDDILIGIGAGEPIVLAAGPHVLTVSAPRHYSTQVSIEIEGMEKKQFQRVELAPAWGTFELISEPAEARVLLDGEEIGVTPLHFEALAGEHELVIHKDGYKSMLLPLSASAGETRPLAPVSLEAADAIVRIRSEPSGANVTAGSVFQGKTPIDVAIDPGKSVTFTLYKVGFQPYSRQLSLKSGEQQTLRARLEALTGKVTITVQPTNAEILVNGKVIRRGASTIELAATEQRLVARAPGYADGEASVTPRPGFPQSVSLKLLTEEEARWAGISSVVTTAAGQEMLLIRPTPFTMGASRREPGRRANETLREVRLERAFYLSRYEVSNEQFREFRARHSSGNIDGRSLNAAKQPVVNISWDDAALYCNWLSERDALAPVYTVSDGSVNAFDSMATGYRLPTEAEWAFAARVGNDGKPYKFAWGNTWPPDGRAGNFADQSAAGIVGQYVQGYQDGEIVSAPVGQFKENWRGFYDQGGNVSEWVHDYYASAASQAGTTRVDPMGPDLGEFHSIRDASYRHGSIVELRLSFRDYGKDGREDLGFRLARYVD